MPPSITIGTGTSSRSNRAFVGRTRGAPLRLEREHVELLAREAPLLGDELGRDPLRHQVRDSARAGAGRTGPPRAPTSPSAPGSCSRRRPRSRRRTRPPSRPARRSGAPAATSRTAGRPSCPAPSRGTRPRAARCGRCSAPARRPATTQPMITSSTTAGSRSLRSTSVRSTCAARSTGCQPGERAVAPPERGADGVDDRRRSGMTASPESDPSGTGGAR